jgi:hypothetical protein
MLRQQNMPTDSFLKKMLTILNVDRTLGLAPASNNSFVTASLPGIAAKCKHVSPSCVRVFAQSILRSHGKHRFQRNGMTHTSWR